MEAMVATPAQDGQQAKSSTEAVSHVLPHSSTFLRNVGLQSVSNISSKGAISVRVQDLQTQLETERQEAARLREEVDSLKTQAKASEATIANQSNEIDSLKKSIQENNNLLRQLLSFNQDQVTPP
jgi:chromosome segregation ATPase